MALPPRPFEREGYSIIHFKNMVRDMNLGKIYCPIPSLLYGVCIEGKQHRATFPNEGDVSDHIFRDYAF